MIASIRRASLPLLLASALSGCFGSLLDSKQPVETIYVIAPQPPASAAQASSIDLSIPTPRLGPGLESARIAVLKGRELNYYSGARWGADVSQLLQSFVVQTLAGQGSFRSVAAADVRATSDYVLAIEVTHFEAEYVDADAPRVHVAFVGRLMKVNERTLLGTLLADAVVPAESNHMGAVVAAFEKATRQATAQLGERVSTAARGAAPAQVEQRPEA